VERNMTREEAQQKAVELAKINAIESVFGTYVEQQTNITVESGKSDFSILGSTKVKGIWIREIDRKFTEEYREEKGEFGAEKILWITCQIKGEVKQATPQPAIEYQVRNCPTKTCHTTRFLSGEQLYLWFRSPVKGFVSVFLEDGAMVYRLLPYSYMLNSNGFPVEEDCEYLFFSPDDVKGLLQSEKPDEIEMYTLRKRENNTLVLVFSANAFYKPQLDKETVNENRFIIPKSLKKEKFEEWLSDNRAATDHFQDITVPLAITSEN
jgi:hypothetical protein